MKVNSLNPNYFIHGANILLVVAYSVRDILWLRVFALAASLITIPYFLLQPSPLWAPLAWTIVFAAINLVQSARLVYERRPVKLTEEEESVRRYFADLPPRRLLEVISIGVWINSETGERLIEHDKRAEAVFLIVSGKVQVTREKRVLGEMTAGNLVGSALLLSGVPAEVDALVAEPVRAVRWEAEALKRYLDAHPDTRTVMQRHLARDLAGKLVGVIRS
jgi:hypothetical protein